MKRLTIVTALLSLLAIWGVLLPMWYIVNQFPPEKTVACFERFRAVMPYNSAFFLKNLTMSKLYVFAFMLSAVIIWLGIRVQKNTKLFACQAGLVASWCLIVALMLLWFFQPLFHMGEVVGGGNPDGRKGPKSEFTQIQFMYNSLYQPGKQLFMQREGEKEVAIPKVEGENWVNVEVASDTNKAFVTVYADSLITTNKLSERLPYWWPIKVVEVTLPLTSQPLANYSLRTLWTCRTRDDVVAGDLIPYHIVPTWDGRFLMVHSRVYDASTNGVNMKTVDYIYDVEHSKLLNAPSAPK